MSRKTLINWSFYFGILSVLLWCVNAENNQKSEQKKENEEVVFLLMMCLGLTSCCVILHVLARYQDVVPYAVVIFVYGVLLSGFFDVNHLNAFHDSLKMWLSINPDLILYIFLPILVFGESMNLNWHHLEGVCYLNS